MKETCVPHDYYYSILLQAECLFNSKHGFYLRSNNWMNKAMVFSLSWTGQGNVFSAALPPSIPQKQLKAEMLHEKAAGKEINHLIRKK